MNLNLKKKLIIDKLNEFKFNLLKLKLKRIVILVRLVLPLYQVEFFASYFSILYICWYISLVLVYTVNKTLLDTCVSRLVYENIEHENIYNI